MRWWINNQSVKINIKLVVWIIKKEMKVRASVKKMCDGCKVIKYNKKVYIKCLENPRHKQRQKFSTMKEM